MNINPIINLISNLISIYNWILIVWIIMSWLIHFKIINEYQPLVRKINEFCYKMTEPLLKPIRRGVARILPNIGVDVSPIILILLLYFMQDVLYNYFYK